MLPNSLGKGGLQGAGIKRLIPKCRHVPWFSGLSVVYLHKMLRAFVPNSEPRLVESSAPAEVKGSKA